MPSLLLHARNANDRTKPLGLHLGTPVRGPTVTLGYWNEPDLTAAIYRPDPTAPEGAEAPRVVFSSDLVRRDSDGYLYFVGRRDRIIKTMGYRVGPDEIASVLYASGEVADAVVVGEPDEARGERIVAHVVLTAHGSLKRLSAYCTRELPRHLQPARIEVHDTLPLLPSGKHDVGALTGEAFVSDAVPPASLRTPFRQPSINYRNPNW